MRLFRETTHLKRIKCNNVRQIYKCHDTVISGTIAHEDCYQIQPSLTNRSGSVVRIYVATGVADVASSGRKLPSAPKSKAEDKCINSEECFPSCR
jgi:hypothetical protein